MKTFLFSCVLILLTFFSCKKEQASIGGGYDLEEGFTVSFGERQVEIQFDKVLADSRCPIGSICAQAGQATIQLVISDNGEETFLELASVDPENKIKEIRTSLGSYKIEFIDLYPYPVLNQPLESVYSMVFTLTDL